MDPQNKNQLPDWTPDGQSQPVQPQLSPVQPVYSGARASRKKPIAIIAALTCVVVVAVIATTVAIVDNQSQNNQQLVVSEPQTENNKDAASEPPADSPLKLVPYSDSLAGFSMLIPEDISMEREADEAFVGGYAVIGGSSTEQYGNRFVTVHREVYPDALALPYDDWLGTERNHILELMQSAKEEDGAEAEITYESNWMIGDYRAHKLNNTITTPSKKGSAPLKKSSSHFFVYISPTESYVVKVSGNTDDVAFQAVAAKIIDSFVVL